MIFITNHDLSDLLRSAVDKREVYCNDRGAQYDNERRHDNESSRMQRLIDRL